MVFSRTALIGIVIVGVVNFVIFLAVAIAIGGDALNGYSSAGHYFLGSHGRYTEVTALVFAYSKWHARSLFVTHPAAMLAGAKLNFLKRVKLGAASSR